MQRTVRASAIALCALATLTACEQNSSTEQQDSAAPDAQPGVASNQDQGTAVVETPQISSPESLILSSSIGDLPALSSRNLPVPRVQRAVPNISATLPIPTRSNWQPRTALAPIQMPNLMVPGSPADSVMQRQSNLVAGQSVNPFFSQAANATSSSVAAARGSTAAIGTAMSPQAYSSQLIASSQPAPADGSQPETQAAGNSFSDLQGHWSQGIISALANGGIVQGFTDGSFRPDQLITQAQFTAMAQKAFPEEQLQPELIQLKSGMTRASAAKAIYEALADQGRMPPISTLVAAQTLPFPTAGQPTPLAALAAAPANLTANSPEVNVTRDNTANAEAIAPQTTAANQPEANQPEAGAQPSPTVTSQPASSAAPEPAALTPAAVTPNALTSAPLTLDTLQVVQPDVIQSQPAPAAPTQSAPSSAAAAEIPSVAPLAPVPVPSAQPESTQANAAQPSSMVAVAVTGEIIRPGAYNLSKADAANGQPTLMQAIQQAGGVTPSADIRQIQVHRTAEGSAQMLTVNLWQTLQTGDLSQDIVLQPGDTIAIPKLPETATAPENQTPPASAPIQISVVGEVNNPGRLELPPNASASQAILASGGFNQQAQQAELIRLNANGTVARRSIELNQLQQGNDSGNLALQNNDVILVQRSSNTATAMRSLPSLMQSPLLGILPFLPAF